MVGSNRITPANAIVHPVGNAALKKDAENLLRRDIVMKALSSLETDIEVQTIFELYKEKIA